MSGTHSQKPKSKADRIKRGPVTEIVFAVSWPLLVQGYDLPWADWIMARMSESEKGRLHRERLSAQLRGADYHLQVGPLWLRRGAQVFREFRLRNRFWLLMAIKILIGLSVVLVPLFTFALYRLFLPDPQAFVSSYAPSAIHLDSRSKVPGSRLVLSPYERIGESSTAAEAIFVEEPAIGALLSNSEPFERAHGAHAVLFGQDSNGLGPGSRVARPVHLLSEQDGLRLELRQASSLTEVSAEILGSNFLEGSFLLISGGSEQTRCRLELRDGSGKLLFSVEKSIEAEGNSEHPYKFSELLRSSREEFSLWQSYSFERDDLPDRLVYSLRRSNIQNENNPGRSCFAAVSPPLFSKRSLKRKSEQRTVVVLIDGLDEPGRRDTLLMPQLSELINEGNSSSRHFSFSPNIQAGIETILFGSSGKGLFEEAHEQGMRTAAFGEFADFFGDLSSKQANELPQEFFEYNRPHYRSLGAALDFDDWLRAHSSGSLFAVVRFSDMKHKLVPPWRDLDFFRFLSDPFGISGHRIRYEGMKRYVDSSLEFLIRSLREVASSSRQNISLIVTAPRGLQSKEFLFEPFQRGALSVATASFSSESGLLPDALHVPLVEAEISEEGVIQSPGRGGVIPGSGGSVTTHQELFSNLRARLRGIKPSDDLGDKSLYVVQGKDSLAGFKFDPKKMTLNFLLMGNQALPERFFSEGNPFSHDRPWNSHKVPVYSGLYNLENHTYIQGDEFDSLQMENLILNEIALRYANDGAIYLRFFGPGVWQGEYEGDKKKLWEPLTLKSTKYTEGARGMDLTQEENGRQLLTITLEDAEQLLLRIPRRSMGSRIRFAGKGPFLLCGETLSNDNFEWDRASMSFFLDDPPSCLLDAVFSLHQEGSILGEAKPSRVEVLAGWKW